MNGMCRRSSVTEADCIRDSRAGDYEGKVLVMRPGVLRPEYWNAAHQLYFAVGGNGARAGGHGTKVFCINIYTGEHTYIRRTDAIGAVKTVCPAGQRKKPPRCGRTTSVKRPLKNSGWRNF